MNETRVVVTAVRAEVLMGFRLASRHTVARTAAGWALGLSVLARVAGGPLPPGRVVGLAVAFGGLLGAAAGPRLMVRGGPLETLRWASLPGGAVVLARVLGAVGFAGVVVAIVTALLSASGLTVAVTAAAVGHAGLVTGLAAGLAPRFGCSTTTALLTAFVGAGVAHEGYRVVVGVPHWVGALTPPGALLADAVAGRPASVVLLGCWFLVAGVALANAGRMPDTRAVR
jgi:hypothetical protein